MEPRFASALGRLDDDWRSLCASSLLRRRLRSWAAETPTLDFATGEALVAAARDDVPGGRAEEILQALLELAGGDPLARRVVLQLLVPALAALTQEVGAWDPEERRARVVAAGWEELLAASGRPLADKIGARIWRNARRRLLRAAIRHRADPTVPTGGSADLEHLQKASLLEESASARARELAELVRWAARNGGLDHETAWLVVATRTGSASINQVASLAGASPQTLRLRRLRAEQRLRDRLVAGAGLEDAQVAWRRSPGRDLGLAP